MRNRRVGFVLLAFGCLSLMRIATNPRLSALHGADIVSLIACGVCLGGGMVAMLARRIVS